jgi:hypothetical protein
MQMQTTVKRFALKHIGGTALALGVLLSSLTVAATLSVTGDFPGRGHAESAHVVDSGSSLRVTAAVAEQRQQRMERDDFDGWHSQTRSGAETSATGGASAADAQRRELQMERAEYSEWRLRLAPPSAAAE